MEIFSFIYSSTGQFIILLIELVFTSVFLFLLFTIIYVLSKSSWLRMTIQLEKAFDPILFFAENKNQKFFGISNAEKKWQAARKRLESPNPADWKLAVIEAENLTEEVLARMGFGGESFGDKIKKLTREQVPGLDDLMASHQTRNDIVHDPDFRISLDDAKNTISGYERALKELEVF